MATITFLGTGLMGAALAEAAVKRGDRVTAWNRTASKAMALAALGVRAAATVPEAVAQAERVHIVLTDDAAVDAVLEAAGDALRSALVVDHSTTSPAGAAERAERLAARGVAFLHAPVFMNPKACREATGVMLAAGPRATFARAEAALRAMTGRLEYLGERTDLAAANKLFGNAMIISICAGLADVYGMAASLGIDATQAHALFGIFNPTGVLTYRGAAMAKGDYTPSFELSMARKDARLMIGLAGNRELAVLPAIAARIDALVARGFGADDLGVLAVDAVPKR
ncbi:MAG TPA: NAD(P)-binding domain-containing protein [Polyangia bacterium]|nr:NAD(P)-binding domain-containing protein [Polyangia bacterium]